MYHWFVIKREALHGAEGVGATVNVFEDDEGLPSHPQRLHSNNVQDLTKL